MEILTFIVYFFIFTSRITNTKLIYEAVQVHIMSSDVDKEIKTRKEYIQSLISNFGSDLINGNKLGPELLEEFNKLYLIIENLHSEISQLKNQCDFLLNLIVSMPEVQNNQSLMSKIIQLGAEESQQK